MSSISPSFASIKAVSCFIIICPFVSCNVHYVLLLYLISVPAKLVTTLNAILKFNLYVYVYLNMYHFTYLIFWYIFKDILVHKMLFYHSKICY